MREFHNQMSELWIDLTKLILLIIEYLIYSVVFIFWFIYLIDAVKRKRIYYKRTLRCLQREDDLHQQTLAYNAETELVKYSFLFFMNLIEWVACTYKSIYNVVYTVSGFNSMNTSTDLEYLTHKNAIIIEHFRLNFPSIDILCMILSITLIGSLCMYLSARYAHKSWIKSNSIPYWICFFVLSSILTQFLISICYTSVIGVWCESLLVALSMIFAWKQYRKLNMVMNWTIVDLQIEGRKRLLLKQIRTKRIFNRTITVTWIALFFVLAYQITHSILQTFLVLFPTKYDSFLFLPLSCVISHISTNGYDNSIINYIGISLEIIGTFIFFIPYTCCGLVTMCVTLWRLCKGTTGYRTHFHNQLYAPLIS